MDKSSQSHTFQRIVVGVDGTARGRDALALAALLRRAGGGELVALHAFPYDSSMLLADAGPLVVLPEDVRVKLEGELSAAGVQASAVVVVDSSTPRALHEYAHGEDADLIVVGSSHVAGAERVLVGDDALGTLHGAPCAVAVAPRGFADASRDLQRIGVGLDGSPEAHAALRLAWQLGQVTDASVRAFSAVLAPLPIWPTTALAPAWPDYEAAMQRTAFQRLDRAREELGDALQGDVTVGDPSAELIARSADVDLLVLGSRAYGPLRRLLLGSTSSKVVRNAACPVLVLPRGAREQAPEAERERTIEGSAR